MEGSVQGSTSHEETIRGCYRVLVQAVAAAERVPASVVSGRLDRILIANALIRGGWTPPEASDV